MSLTGGVRARSVLVLLVAAVLGVSQLGAQAAPRSFVAADAAGDALAGTHGDLLKLGLTTQGVLRRGRYTPQSLVLTLQTVDAIDRRGTTQYEVDLSLPGCSGGFRAWATPGVPSAQHVSCHVQPADLTFTMDIAPEIRGNTLTWVVPFDDFPGGVLSAGQVARQVHAFSRLREVATPVPVHNDDVTTAARYTLG